jgi:hypothetical protein
MKRVRVVSRKPGRRVEPPLPKKEATPSGRDVHHKQTSCLIHLGPHLPARRPAINPTLCIYVCQLCLSETALQLPDSFTSQPWTHVKLAIAFVARHTTRLERSDFRIPDVSENTPFCFVTPCGTGFSRAEIIWLQCYWTPHIDRLTGTPYSYACEPPLLNVYGLTLNIHPSLLYLWSPFPHSHTPAAMSNSLEAKIVVLGSQGVGKTSLVHRYVKNAFAPSIHSTIGASFLTKRVVDIDSSTVVRLQIWDTAGQERFRSISKLYYRGTNLYLKVMKFE